MTAMTRRAAPPAIDSDHGDDWRERSACRDHDGELFFPLGGPIQGRSGANLDQERAAKAVCYRCPVREACLRDALRAGDEWGIWGGLNERERRELVGGVKPMSEPLQIAAAKSADVRAERAAARTHCNNGHELTEDNVWMQGNHRVCRTCRRAQAAAWRVAHKAATA